MFGKKKEDDAGLPDLPALPLHSFRMNDDEEDDFDNEKHALPTFPDSPSHNRFSQAAIKDAVAEEDEGLPEIPAAGDAERSKVVEMEEWEPSEQRASPRDEWQLQGVPTGRLNPVGIERQAPIVQRQAVRQFVKESDAPDVFVKIDKFHSAKRALTDVREKLQDIDELIKKIRDTKMREEQELTFWERNVAQIKARIENVSESIFEKVD